jgi:hypothetical protein
LLFATAEFSVAIISGIEKSMPESAYGDRLNANRPPFNVSSRKRLRSIVFCLFVAAGIVFAVDQCLTAWPKKSYDKGPRPGSRPPRFSLLALDGKQIINIRDKLGKTPLCLLFGSFT